MKIERKIITLKDLVEGYEERGTDGIDGVVAYGGQLDVRPPYQREFIYGDKDRDAVIRSVERGFPIGIMYWEKLDDGRYQLLDGQQRTISIASYVADESFSVDYQYFFNLPQDKQEAMLNYELDIYICQGLPSEILDWFKIINVAGKPLEPQEIRNAAYVGPWLSDAKFHFSKPQCGAYNLASEYMSGSPIRQKYLETAIKWIAARDGLEHIEDYMAKHQKDSNASVMWNYFQAVINWAKTTFPFEGDVPKEAQKVEWGILYNEYKDRDQDSQHNHERFVELYADPCVTDRAGIFEYILGGEKDKSLLNIRVFSKAVIKAVYAKQTKEAKAKGISNCPLCALGEVNKDKIWSLKDMDADHVTAWSKGGATDIKNCQMLCKTHNRAKGNR